MAEKPTDVKLSALMSPKGKKPKGKKKFAKSYKEAKEACGE